MKGTVHTEGAPAAIGPYAQGVWAGGLFFSAGQIGLDPDSGELVPGGVEAEIVRVLRNLEAVLKAARLGFDDVVKTTVFLVDMSDFVTVNRAYAERFRAPHPARSTVQVAALPRGARVEIEVIAHRG
ncbi:MAG: RidA family protein [Gemmatimonadota bacterium]